MSAALEEIRLTWDQRDTLETLGEAAALEEPFVREWSRPRTVRPGPGKLGRVRVEIAEQLERLGLAEWRFRPDSDTMVEWKATAAGLDLLALRRSQGR